MKTMGSARFIQGFTPRPDLSTVAVPANGEECHGVRDQRQRER